MPSFGTFADWNARRPAEASVDQSDHRRPDRHRCKECGPEHRRRRLCSSPFTTPSSVRRLLRLGMKHFAGMPPVWKFSPVSDHWFWFSDRSARFRSAMSTIGSVLNCWRSPFVSPDRSSTAPRARRLHKAFDRSSTDCSTISSERIDFFSTSRAFFDDRLHGPAVQQQQFFRSRASSSPSSSRNRFGLGGVIVRPGLLVFQLGQIERARRCILKAAQPSIITSFNDSVDGGRK